MSAGDYSSPPLVEGVHIRERNPRVVSQVTKNQPSVVVIDGPPETEQVLKAVLEPQGHRICRFRRDDAQHLPAGPRLLIVHGDAIDETPNHTPRVVIGPPRHNSVNTPRTAYLSQPYQYSELVQLVEDMMG